MATASRVVLALLTVAAVFAAASTDAAACSCVSGDPRRMLAEADAAFVGRLVERPTGSFSSSAELAPYVFEVEQAVKGTLPQRLEVLSPVSGASCGIEAPLGRRIGLFLSRQGGQWHSSLCQQVDPEQLLAAARPLPAPTGKGPVALVAGGSFGEARTIALDRDGRTLGYGRGRGETILLDVCPGERRVVEIVRDRAGTFLAVRDLRTRRLVREQKLRLRENLFPSRVDCRSRSGDAVLLFATRESGPLGVISLLRGARSQELYRGRGVAAVFGGSVAYVVTGSRADRLVAVDLAQGSIRRLGAVPAGTGALALSPSGSRLAGVAYSALVATEAPSRVVVVALRPGTARLRSTPLPGSNVSGTVGWLDDERFAFLPAGGDRDVLRVYDTQLRLQARLGWRARLGVIRNGTAYGITWGREARVLRAALPGGPTRSTSTLPSQTVYTLAAVTPAGR